MNARTPALAPWPLGLMLARVAEEWERRRSIFDLTASRFHRQTPDLDLSIDVMGRRAATPLGPAAGPHTQLAQNIVLGWLAGARSFELKTVQIRDDLEIPRPCIDVATVGTNVEWSQELTREQSLEQYVAAMVMLEILGRWRPLREVLGRPGGHVFELSVGYDLAGIRSPAMAAFLDAAADCGELVDRLRGEIPAPFADLRDVDFPLRLAHSVNVSTFHGCPPEEIAAIAGHLMERHDLDVTVKLNPTLLGPERTREILDERLGHHDLVAPADAFAADLKFEQALSLIGDLHRRALSLGRRFGVKLTNTLVVENARGRLPGERMYLSGPPLHVLSATLLAELDRALPGLLRLGPDSEGDLPVSFSAGVDRGNVAEMVGLGLAPVTVCTALLRPNGYARLSAMLRGLGQKMAAAGCADIPAWLQSRRDAALAEGHATAAGAYAARLATVEGAAPYRRDAVTPPARVEDSVLPVWDCTSCNLCVSVCPNDAMIRMASPASAGDRLERKWQYACLADLCNDCGNCETFCPDGGKPHRVKPRLHLMPQKYVPGEPGAYRVRTRDGALVVEGGPDADLVGAMVAAAGGLPLPPDAPFD